MAETKEIKQENTFDDFYNDLSNNWNDNIYIIQKITNLNLNECNFLPYQKKFLEGCLLQKQGKHKEGFRCYQESNEIEENGYAMNNLGYCYKSGIGVDKNAVEAVRFYKLAIKKGNIIAINNLGCCYKTGEGVEKNIIKALKLFKECIEKGCNRPGNLLKCYKELTYNHKYKFYKSLPKNSSILKEIKDAYQIECLQFDNLNEIDELKRLVYLPPYANPRFPNGGLGFQQALSSRNDFNE